MMVLQEVLLCISVFTMLGVLVIGALVIKTRKDKIMKAASPPLLYVMLIGSLIMQSEAVIGCFPADKIICMAQPWLHHTGFAVAYGVILVKTWRISVIMKMVNVKSAQTTDAQLFRAVAILVLISGVYLLVWTLVDPVQPVIPPQLVNIQGTNTTESAVRTSDRVCVLPVWEQIISAGEFCFLLWGGILCYQARKAPDMYNETQPIRYIIWNEAIWIVFHMFTSYTFSLYPDFDMSYSFCFLRVQCTVTVTLLLLFVTKDQNQNIRPAVFRQLLKTRYKYPHLQFQKLFRRVREIHGAVAEVHGTKRVHRLSLIMSNSGAITTINCVPCGPLMCVEEPDEESESETSEYSREKQYTTAEVDILIEMVARLKNDNRRQKAQINRLCDVIKECITTSPVNGLFTYPTSGTPNEGFPQNKNQIADLFPDQLRTCLNERGSKYESVFNRRPPNHSPDITMVRDPICSITKDIHHAADTKSDIPLNTRKASTVTTCLSSPDLDWPIERFDMDQGCLLVDTASHDVDKYHTSNDGASTLHGHLCQAHNMHYGGVVPDCNNHLDLRRNLTLDVVRNITSATHSTDIDAVRKCIELVNMHKDNTSCYIIQDIQENCYSSLIDNTCDPDGSHSAFRNAVDSSDDAKCTNNVTDVNLDCHIKSNSDVNVDCHVKSNTVSNPMNHSNSAITGNTITTHTGFDNTSFVMYI